EEEKRHVFGIESESATEEGSIKMWLAPCGLNLEREELAVCISIEDEEERRHVFGIKGESGTEEGSIKMWLGSKAGRIIRVGPLMHLRLPRLNNLKV
ncbi:hypothetical protein Tco_0841482, partial [Tanacetum coccineum]